jgi:small subunit ribosomal protein S30e
VPTHGSLTKAGKVRNQTPKLAPLPKKNPGPKSRNRGNYKKRFLNQTDPMGTRGRRRGRRRR